MIQSTVSRHQRAAKLITFPRVGFHNNRIGIFLPDIHAIDKSQFAAESRRKIV